MKKLLFAALVLTAMCQAVNAQTGSILVGGSINLNSTKTPAAPSDIKTTSFDFNPTVGYQFTDNWTAGIVADISSVKTTYADNSVVKNNGFVAGPFIRYAKSLSGIFAIYGQLQGTFGTVSHATTANINAFPAIFINVKQGFGLNFTVGGIGYSSSKPSGGNASTGFNFNFGKTVGIGISKNFGGNRKK